MDYAKGYLNRISSATVGTIDNWYFSGTDQCPKITKMTTLDKQKNRIKAFCDEHYEETTSEKFDYIMNTLKQIVYKSSASYLATKKVGIEISSAYSNGVKYCLDSIATDPADKDVFNYCINVTAIEPSKTDCDCLKVSVVTKFSKATSSTMGYPVHSPYVEKPIDSDYAKYEDSYVVSLDEINRYMEYYRIAKKLLDNLCSLENANLISLGYINKYAKFKEIKGSYEFSIDDKTITADITLSSILMKPDGYPYKELINMQFDLSKSNIPISFMVSKIMKDN